MSEKTIEVAKPILDKNDRLADELRQLYAEHGVFVVNLLSGPGSGKTSTILATIAELSGRYNVAVIEGDIASDVDAQKVRPTVPPPCRSTRAACAIWRAR